MRWALDGSPPKRGAVGVAASGSPESGGPASQEDRHRGSTQQPLRDETRRPREHPGAGQAEDGAGDQAEQVAPQVGAPTGPQHREQAEACGDGDERAASADPATPTARDTQRRQDSHGPEDRCGGSHRRVLRTVEEGVREVSDAAGSQHERAPQADTQRAARGADEDGAGDRIPENVSEIGVEGERRQRAPWLSVQDSLGVGAPALEPVHGGVARTRDREERQQQSGDRQARGEVDRRRWLLLIRRRRRVLAFVGGERRGGSLAFLLRNLDREATTAARDRGVEPFG
jgi:hypothetical protein